VSTGGETAKRDGTGLVGTENPAVAITGLHKWFGEFRVLADINLEVARGERIVICGPSGSGKSTLLRCVNALEEFQRGEIVVDGLVLTKDVKRIDAWCSSISTCFRT
jgi:general L-amino acid transport system ATP-binding protein